MYVFQALYWQARTSDLKVCGDLFTLFTPSELPFKFPNSVPVFLLCLASSDHTICLLNSDQFYWLERLDPF